MDLREPDVFETLALEYQDAAYRAARRFVHHVDAEDVVQEALLRAFRARERFTGGSFRAWLVRIVTNVAIDELRSRGRSPAVCSLDEQRGDDDVRARIDVSDPGPLPDEALIRAELRRELTNALGELSPARRSAVVYHDVLGLSQVEIAQRTGVPIGTVKSRISRGRSELRCTLTSGERSEW